MVNARGTAAIVRVTLVVLLGLGLCVVALAEVWVWRGGLIRIPLPIAEPEGFPLPLIYWASVAIYTAWYGRLFRVPMDEGWARAMRLGIGLHVLLLIASLPGHFARNPHVQLAPAYICYWHLVWGLALALGWCGVVWLIVRWRRSRTADPWLFFLTPLVGGAVTVSVSALSMPLLVTMGAVVGGVVLWLGMQAGIVQPRTARLGQLMANERVFLAMVFLLALALRIFYTLRIMSDPDFLNTGSDGPLYDQLAWALVNRQPLQQIPAGTVAWFAPGYVRFVALLYWLGGRNYFLVCAVQSVLGAMACLLLYGVAKRLFGTLTARIAAVFGVVNFPMIFAAAAIGHQAVDLFWTLLVVWCIVRYLDDPTRWGRWIVGIGLLLGWAAVTREGNLVVWFFLIGWFLLGVRAKLGWRRAALHLAGVSTGFLLVLLPFLHDSHGGVVGRIAGQWFVHQHSSVYMHTWFNPWHDPAGARAMLQAQPLTVAMKLGEAVLGNVKMLFFNQGYGVFDPVFLVRRSTYYYGMWWYAYGLAFYGMGLVLWQALRAPLERLGWWWMMGVLVARTAPHLFLEAGYRHRAPMEPYLIMLAAYALMRLLSIERGAPGRFSPPLEATTPTSRPLVSPVPIASHAF